jgi:hypothetical protein
MTRSGQKLIALVGLVLLTVLFGRLWFVADECSRTENCGGYRSAEYSTPNQKHEETVWDRTISDPIALYTFLLAIFTLALAAASVFQGYFLIRADSTAKTAADAALATANAINTQNTHIENSLAEAKRAADEMSNLAKATGEANKISRDHLIAANRAWLQVTVRVTGVGHDQANDMLTVNFAYTIRNLGTAPAVRTHIQAEIILSFDNLHEHQKRISENAKSAAAMHEPIIFPGNTLEKSVTYIGHGNQEILQSIQKYSGFLVINLIGCVDYQFPAAADHRQTWFAYGIDTKDDQDRRIAIRTDGIPTIAADRLVLSEAFATVHYAD